jgi:uncharacterized membrane protein YhaH (DUF805 family)
MNFGQAIASGFRNYATFGGRACRSKYWYWTLFGLIVSIVAGILDGAIFPIPSTRSLQASPLCCFFPALQWRPDASTMTAPPGGC